MKLNYEKRIFGLDLLRAIAIILVIVSHVIWIIPPITNTSINSLVSLSGYLGVEIFFVLSGFLIGRILFRLYTSAQFSLKDVGYFLTRRWFRTLPNYYLILIVNILVALLLQKALPINLGHYLLFIQNFAWSMPPFFGESWSLSIEEFAYILGPFLLFLVLKFKTAISRSWAFLGVTLFVILSFLLTKIYFYQSSSISSMVDWNIQLKAVVIYRIDAIFYGVLTSYIYSKFQVNWIRFKYYSLLLGALIIVGLNIAIPKLNLFIDVNPLFWVVFYLPINSIAIGLTLPYFSTLHFAPRWILKTITAISVLSYAMYLVHFSIVVQLINYFQTQDLVQLPKSFYVAAYIGLTIFMSYLLYKYYERPITKLRDRPEIKNYFK
ncbi:MAG: acyltransferase [Winogradskyella sp.]|uniref:acyltransferase family protein n=1 Tax=Winogradskyella sp. TaxID=1883156 RepID=UPI00184B5388|nr:acyltransferase [Winogradskyella sp.]